MDEERLLRYWFESTGRNTTILLNLPPDRRGLIHEKDAQAVKQWQQRLERIFSHDLAADGLITAGWEALLDPDFDEVAAAAELQPQIRVDFPEERTFDCFRIQETIELGHRIRGFRVEALTEDGWNVLKEGKCIGFCRAERFAPVRAKAVRLTVTEAAALPVLRSFGVYSGAAPAVQAETYPKEPPVAQVMQKDGVIEISLEGIYPYDTVELSPAPEKWQVHAFNGTDYVLTAEAEGGEARFPAVTGSYRLKLTAESFLPDTKVKIFWSEGTE
jgi:alpha-L-fucosidase